MAPDPLFSQLTTRQTKLEVVRGVLAVNGSPERTDRLAVHREEELCGIKRELTWTVQVRIEHLAVAEAHEAW